MISAECIIGSLITLFFLRNPRRQSSSENFALPRGLSNCLSTFRQRRKNTGKDHEMQNKQIHFVYVTIFASILSPFRKVERYMHLFELSLFILYSRFNSLQLFAISTSTWDNCHFFVVRLTLSAAKGLRDRPRTRFNGAHHRGVHGPEY